MEKKRKGRTNLREDANNVLAGLGGRFRKNARVLVGVGLKEGLKLILEEKRGNLRLVLAHFSLGLQVHFVASQA